METAKKIKAESISIPAISSGIFGFPKERVMGIILQTCVNWAALNLEDAPVKTIRLIAFNDEELDAYKTEFKKRFVTK